MRKLNHHSFQDESEAPSLDNGYPRGIPVGQIVNNPYVQRQNPSPVQSNPPQMDYPPMSNQHLNNPQMDYPQMNNPQMNNPQMNNPQMNYYPPPSQFAPQVQQQSQPPYNSLTLVSQAHNWLTQPKLLDHPVAITCRVCNLRNSTTVICESGNITHAWACFICLCVGPCFCCLPYAFDSCLDKSHYCSNCGANLIRKHQKCFDFIC